MVEFTNLDFKNGILNIRVDVEKNNPYWNSILLKRIIITTDKSFGKGSTMPTYSNSIGADNSDIIFDSESYIEGSADRTYWTVTNNSLGIKQNPANFKDSLLVIWVTCDYSGATGVVPPCGEDPTFEVMFFFDKCPIINEIVKTSKEVERPCGIPKSFIDTLLRYAALNYAILAKDWERVIKFWSKFYTKIGKHITTKCGCHG